MPIKFYLAKEFEHRHEREIFPEFVDLLNRNLNPKVNGFLIGNVSVGGVDFDAIFVKQDAIIIIDFKNYEGKLFFSENGPWKLENGISVMGGSKANPYVQLRNNKSILYNFLNANSGIFTNNKPEFSHITGLIIFSKPISVINKDQISPKIATWLSISDFQNCIETIKNITSPKICLSDSEQQRFLDLLGYETIVTPVNSSKKQNIDDKLFALVNDLYIFQYKSYLVEVGFKHIESLITDLSQVKLASRKTHLQNKYDRIFGEATKIRNEISKDVETKCSKINEFKSELNVDISYLGNLETVTHQHLKSILDNNFSTKNKGHYLDEHNSTIKDFVLNLSYRLNLYIPKYFEILIGYYLHHSDKAKIIPLLKVISNYLTSIYSDKFFWSADIKTIVPFNAAYTDKLLYCFDDAILHTFDNVSYNTITKDRVIRLFYKNIKLPNTLIEVQNNLLKNLLECFEDTTDYYEFIHYTGLDFISDDNLKNDEVDFIDIEKNLLLVKSVDSGIINTHLMFGEEKKYEHNFIPVFRFVLNKIFDPIYQIKFDIDEKYLTVVIPGLDKVNEIIHKWNNEEVGDNLLNAKKINYEYSKIVDKYCAPGYIRYHSKSSIVSYLKRNIPSLKSYNEIYDDQLYKMRLSKRAYNLLYQKFVVEQEIYFKERKNKSNKSDEFSNEPNLEDINVEEKEEKQNDLVKGYDDVKKFIRSHLFAITNPEIKKLIKLDNPDGIIFYGPPGCGKTLFARWIAVELGYMFIEVPRSSFGSPYVDGAMNELIKKLNEFKKKSKQVIFFDEFDSVAINRNRGDIHAESEKVVNTLLQEIPNLSNAGNIVVAATNYLSKLDDAVIRSGRFGLKIPIFQPSSDERIEIIKDSVFKSFAQGSPLIEYLNEALVSDDRFWESFTTKQFLFNNADLKLIAQKITMYVLEKYQKGEKIILSDIVQLNNSITVKCRNYIEFKNELSENYSEAYSKRFNNLIEELEMGGCLTKNKEERTKIGYV